MKFKDYKIPDLSDKTIIITGANSGIGFYVARKFAQKNATIIFACRNEGRALRAIHKIEKEYPKAQCKYIHLDLHSFNSINKFIKIIQLKHPTIDILINNAGVIMQNTSELSKDGLNPHTATNCLGPFLLSISLIDNLRRSGGARIVTVSSFVEKMGCFNLNKFTQKYQKGWSSYIYSKTANLILSYELDRRLKNAKIRNVMSVACHPGLTASNSTQLKYLAPFLKRFSMPVEQGAQSVIIAATSDKLFGGEYIGFDGPLNISGTPCINKSSKITKNEKLALQLWRKCEGMVGTFSAY